MNYAQIINMAPGKFKLVSSDDSNREIWEVADNVGLLTLSLFLQSDDLPSDMALSFAGRKFVFRTSAERIQFALGVGLSFEIMLRNS